MEATIVLAHGLWMHGLAMRPLAGRLHRAMGLPVHCFSYPSVSGGAADNLQRLLDCLAGIATPGVHLVGHSLGGVLALRAAQRLASRPGRVVCLGAPLLGSAAGQALRRWPGGARLLGRTLDEAVLHRPLDGWHETREVGVIAGRLGVGAGLLLGVLQGEHDGAVTVAETRLPGITGHVVLPVTHTGMLLSARVADQAAHFLRTGAFLAA